MGDQNDDGGDSDNSERGYEAQSENESADDSAPRRHKRFTGRSRQPVDTTDISSMPGSSSQSSAGYNSVERSESGHALFYDPLLKAWRRDQAGVRKRHKSTAPLTLTELTPSVTNMKRTHSGTPIVYDRWRGYWHRERRHRTVNFNKLTPEQQDAKQTASGTKIYYDEQRMEWRRWRDHPSDVPTPTKTQQVLKRTGSGSAIVYDSTRKVWKRKRKRLGPLSSDHLLEAQREAATGWERNLVHDKDGWYLEKKRKHLQEGELSKRQIKAQRTSSGTTIAYDSVHRRWKRVLESDDAPTSGGADRSDPQSGHRHHHGFKRVTYVYTKSKLTGKWTKKQQPETDYLNKRLRTPDGGYVFFDDDRLCWRKAKVDVPEEKKLSLFGRLREYLFGEDDDEDEQTEARATTQHFQSGSADYNAWQQQQSLQQPARLNPSDSGPRRTARARTSYRPGLWRRIKRFFASLCRFLRIC